MPRFSLHAGVDIASHQREKLERLCRYVSRPPVASERLALTASGQVRYTLKTPYRDGTTHIVLEPLDLMARLAALVPTPRMHLTRYHGVFAPHSNYRAAVTPAQRGRSSLRRYCRTWSVRRRSSIRASCRSGRGGRRYNPGCCEQDDESRFRCRVREPVGARLSRIERAAAWAVCGRRGTLIWRPGNGRGSAQKPTGGPICQANHAAPKLGPNIRPVRRTGVWGQTWTGRVV